MIYTDIDDIISVCDDFICILTHNFIKTTAFITNRRLCIYSDDICAVIDDIISACDDFVCSIIHIKSIKSAVFADNYQDL